ncbi:MAG: neutral zinc metallopeptidase, partial [Acidimicrobiia bacterium]|nr:neutral zinc metallopeptidase [Acidimicrobiia bacterium]
MLGFKPLPAPEPAPPAADGGRVDAPDPNDPADRADPDDPDTGDPGRIDPATDVPSTDPVVEAADSARADLQAHWSSVGAVPSAVALVVVPDDQRLVVTACAAGPVDGSAAAFYCPADDTIVVARRILAAIERGFGLHAAEAIIAHEYAHNVQAERGLVFARVVDAELQADCLAGQWSRSRRERALVGQAGIDDAARLFWLLGDYEFGSADHHGTPGERLGAFYRGVDGRDCPVSWSALTGTAPAG